jgi:ABC-type transporter Mla subunit MlaD
MPLQDLTPELRTRLSRVEKMVGWFVIVATVILLVGFGYYLYDTAQNRGWFVTKINYATALNDFSGLKMGDPVRLMGFPAGEITDFSLNAPEKPHGIKVFFTIRAPYYNYIWYDSFISVKSDILGNRYLEVSKGQSGAPTVSTNLIKGKLLVLNRYQAFKEYKAMTNALGTNTVNKDQPDEDPLVLITNKLMELITNNVNVYYTNAMAAKYANHPINPDPNLPVEKWNYCWIPAIDAPTLEDRLGSVARQVEVAVPNILAMTNQLAAILSNANNAVARLDKVLAQADPIMTNVNTITANLRDPNGSLGTWLIPTNLEAQLHETLHSATQALNSAHSTIDDTDTNLTRLATDLDKTLAHLADLTSNLNSQVQANTNLIGQISTAIVHTDDLVQGLKREWFLRGAFKNKKPKKDHSTNAPLPSH